MSSDVLIDEKLQEPTNVNGAGAMLQQILHDMWVDPEILAGLDDTQKQTLFCKMREEQVRRWQAWDEKVSKDRQRPKYNNNNNSKKQVQFMQGEDGEPWVWVMGEHPEDKSIETILAEEARQRALKQAREEAHQLRKSVEKELTQLIDYKPMDSLDQTFDISPKSIDNLEDSLEIYCTVDELRQRIDELEPEVQIPEKDDMSDKLEDKSEYCNGDLKMDLNKNTLHFNFIEGKRDVLQDLGISNNGDAVMSRVAAWERRVAAARAGDILRGLKARRARSLRDAQLKARDDDEIWREQERKAKEAEAAMREIARAARAAHRREHAASPAAGAGAAHAAHAAADADKPGSREAVIEWFRKNELPRMTSDMHQWFHGVLSRAEAELALSAAPPGAWLLRLSARSAGLALSYRAPDRTKHFLLDAPRYRLRGSPHASLADLIKYHQTVPITESGGEILRAPCAPAAPVVF